jgi:adenine-specific DNA-methyltransferase
MARKKKDPTAASPDVDAIRHKQKRKNIPTEELRDFVADDENKPPKMLYPRDPSLDPQLVWKGKDEQDRQPLEVEVVPIYIQEVIEPSVIIDAIEARKTTKPDNSGYLPGFFDDFDDMGFDRKVEFYQHDQHWANRMILGNSLHVMTSLAEKEGLKGKVQMIYMDPPYGIKFGSNWQVSTRKRDVTDGKAQDATRQPEQVRAFRDIWKLGVHSYLAVLRNSLMVARELLTDTGSVFVQIGDENAHLVRSVLDEVFGPQNVVSVIQFTKTSSASSELLAGIVDYVVWYAKDIDSIKYRPLYRRKAPGEHGATKYDSVELPDGTRRLFTSAERQDSSALPPGSRVFTVDQLTSQKPPGSEPFSFQGKTFSPLPGYWKTGPDGLSRLSLANRLVIAGNKLRYIRYVDDFSVFSLNNLWADTGSVQSRTDPKIYVVQTATSVITRCLLMSTDPGDLVLDPTCGSGTAAYVAEQWGRRWIAIDTSRVALALARTRLMAAKFPYYVLADSPEGLRKEAELTGQERPSYPTAGDIRKGFVYKRVPHVTLKSIANNPDIREGMTRAEIDAAIARPPRPKRFSTSPMKTRTASGSAARSRSKACRPTGSSRPTRSGRSPNLSARSNRAGPTSR